MSLLSRNFNDIFDKFDNIFKDFGNAFDSITNDTVNMEISSELDLEEENGNYVMHLDINNVKKNGIDIKVKGGVLGIKVIKEMKKDNGKTVRSTTVYSRSLPSDAIVTQMEAVVNGGQLNITIPKK